MENTTLEAIEQISNNVQEYKEILGKKADKETITGLETQLKDLANNFNELSEKELDKAIEQINKGNKDLSEAVQEMSEDLKELKDNSTGKSNNSREAVEKQIKAFQESFFDEDSRKNYHTKDNITIKAAETFGFNQTFNGDGTGVQIDAFTGREVDPELYQPKRKRNLILDRFRILPVTAPTLYYLEKEVVGNASAPANEAGAADWISAGASKPKRSFRLKTGKVEAKKVAIFATVQDKLVRDVSSMVNWIREDLTDEMREAINDGLLNNNPSVNADAPLGLKTNAVQYAVTPAFDSNVADPNYIDAIIATLAFMAENKETPGSVHVSTDVYYRIHNLKATDGKWLNNNLVYVNAMGQLFIAGIQVFAEDSEDVPSTHVLAISNDEPFKIRSYGNSVLEPGLNGEDFREDKTSFRGYQEFMSYLPENRENGVVYDTFANIYAAITTA